MQKVMRNLAVGLCYATLATAALATVPPADALPSPTTGRAAVLGAAVAAAAAHLQVPPAAVLLREPDARLAPPACNAGFQGKVAPGTGASGRVTVEVSCAGLPWRTFIAARLDTGVATVAGEATPHSGKGTARVQFAAAARQPPAVRRGSPVTLSIDTGSFRVATAGVALADAPLGALVRVRNGVTGREVEGRVIGDGQVALATTASAMQGIPQVAAEAVDNTSAGQLARRGDNT